MKNLLFFILAVAISLPAAMYRWGDSTHASGYITVNGGNARHSRPMQSGYGRYSLVATVRVRPPYSGDARVVLEGTPKLDHDIYLSGLPVDLGIRERPALEDGVIYNLQPGHKINLRIVIREPASGENIKGQYTLALYDTATDRSVLRVPLKFKTPGASRDEKPNRRGQ